MLGHVERETNQPSEAQLSFQQALAALRVHPSLHDTRTFL